MPINALAKNIGVTVGGRWVALDAFYGDVELSTGVNGPDQLTWTPGGVPTRRYTGGSLVVGHAPDSPVSVFAGTLTEPDPSQDQMTADGAWKAGGDWLALDGSGNATKIPDTAIDRAIGDGLAWIRPASISSSAVDIDTTQGPVTLGALLDAWATAAGKQWVVNARREILAVTPPTTPTWQTFPLDGGLGYDRTNYASTLVGLWFDGTTYQKTIVTDPVALANHGPKEVPVSLIERGTLTSLKATTILTNLLALGMATPAWTQGIALSYGELLTMGGVAAALESVSAGGAPLLRVHGGFELAQRLNGRMYLDVPIGRTSLSGGPLTMQPAEIATKNLADFVASMKTHTRAA